MRFGIATREITPPFPTRMHGYAARQDMFDGSHDPLTFTAVVVEEGGRRALIGAADICTFPNDGSLPGFMDRLMPFDPGLLGYPWSHSDPRVDRLQRALQDCVARGEQKGIARRDGFAAIWRMAHEAAGRTAPALAGHLGAPIPHLSEAWYCCAEPTDRQLRSF